MLITTQCQKPDPVGASVSQGPSAEESEQSVEVVAEDYLGLPVAQARRRLTGLGLRCVVERRANPGTEEAGTVADVDPTGSLEAGTTVTLTVWDEVREELTPTVEPKPKPKKAPKDKQAKPRKGPKGRR